MYYLACCDDEGKCFGYLDKNNNPVSDENKFNDDYLLTFKDKRTANEKIMQINLGKILLPNGYPFRVVAVKG